MVCGAPSGPFWRSTATVLEPLRAPLWAPLSHLWGPFGPLWSVRARWGPFGSPMRPFWCPCGTPQEPVWSLCVAPERPLRGFFGARLRPHRGRFGPSFGAPLRHFWSPCRAGLGPFWGSVGAPWGLCGPPVGPLWSPTRTPLGLLSGIALGELAVDCGHHRHLQSVPQTQFHLWGAERARWRGAPCTPEETSRGAAGEGSGRLWPGLPVRAGAISSCGAGLAKYAPKGPPHQHRFKGRRRGKQSLRGPHIFCAPPWQSPCANTRHRCKPQYGKVTGFA